MVMGKAKRNGTLARQTLGATNLKLGMHTQLDIYIMVSFTLILIVQLYQSDPKFFKKAQQAKYEEKINSKNEHIHTILKFQLIECARATFEDYFFNIVI